MQISTNPVSDSRVVIERTNAAESAVSAVSWAAIIAGAFAMVAVGLNFAGFGIRPGALFGIALA
jgi:hypothetical protein